jgi:hypothetical protein
MTDRLSPGLAQLLKDACDRDWKDETPEQIVKIAANGLYWRDKEIAQLKAELAAAATREAKAVGGMKEAACDALDKVATECDGWPRISDGQRAIRALGGKEAQAAIQHIKAEAQVEAINQCAIEAGERTPEGVSSGTQLGAMWDERIATLEAAARGDE